MARVPDGTRRRRARGPVPPRLDLSGAPSAPCYEKSVVNGMIDQRGVPAAPVTTFVGRGFARKTVAHAP